MPKRPKPKPHYPLSDVKKLIRAGKVDINSNATSRAWDDFNWKSADIKKCLLKLNDKYHSDDRKNNHFHKTEEHTRFPNTKMDYYKCKDIMEGMSVYMHFYIHPSSGKVIVSSFKEL
ncbi:MAG TPA: hypothetical protein ENK92_01820 [Bacteroidetes bacterium]|nr:hypothetical protein [Bacteroidota bacterium]